MIFLTNFMRSLKSSDRLDGNKNFMSRRPLGLLELNFSWPAIFTFSASGDQAPFKARWSAAALPIVFCFIFFCVLCFVLSFFVLRNHSWVSTRVLAHARMHTKDEHNVNNEQNYTYYPPKKGEKVTYLHLLVLVVVSAAFLSYFPDNWS